MNLEIVTFVSEILEIDPKAFSVTGKKVREEDIVLRRVLSVSGVETHLHSLHDVYFFPRSLEDSSRALEDLYVKESQVLKGWKFTIQTEFGSTPYIYFDKELAERMNGVVRQTLMFHLKGSRNDSL